MTPMFKMGDKVHLMPDTTTIYMIITINEKRYGYSYNLLPGPVVDVQETSLELAD